jgi:nuclear RNA export factor
LGNRFDAPSKTLNLANLGGDPILTDMGLFNSTKTESKFFQALMKLWTLNFESDQESREAVESLSLANNQLTSIQHISILSQHFPRVKLLDLSNNQIKDYKEIAGWRWKFRQLEFLNLLNNKISEDHTFKDTMMKWYPNLKVLNNVQVRTDQEVAAHHRSSIPVQPPLFQDDSQIAQSFIPYFFSGFDDNRDNLLHSVYDSGSTFSFNVNTNAPRGTQDTITPAGWDNYIKKSRNLMRISHLSARMNRIHVGVENIREVWRALPHTRHPNIATNPEQWLVECYPLPAVPDPTGQIPSGVGGLLIMVHSSFQESGDAKTLIRSFDRTLVLGPGGGAGAVRVVSDMLTLRAYGGHTAWDPEGQMSISPAAPIVAAPANAAVIAPATPDHPEAPQGYGKPAPSKSADDLQKEQKILQLSFSTKMTLFYSQMALENNNWDVEAALKAFEAAKVSASCSFILPQKANHKLQVQGNIPQDAFIPGV